MNRSYDKNDQWPHQEKKNLVAEITRADLFPNLLERIHFEGERAEKNISIASSKIAVTLDNYSKKWYNMSQGDEKNG